MKRRVHVSLIKPKLTVIIQKYSYTIRSATSY